jgi:hypothetical protein
MLSSYSSDLTLLMIQVEVLPCVVMLVWSCLVPLTIHRSMYFPLDQLTTLLNIQADFGCFDKFDSAFASRPI